MSHLSNVKREGNVVVPKAGEKYVADDGTVSQVLDDTIDDSYEPTAEEIEEYGVWMGMKLPEDRAFLWIAREGLKTPLPKEWKPCRTDDDQTYYFNFKTGESSWDHPMDSVIRQKFEMEKKRVENAKTTSPAEKVALATAAVAGNPNSSRLVLTEVGLQQRPGSTTLGSASLATNASRSGITPLSSAGNTQVPTAKMDPLSGTAATAAPTVAPRFVSELERALEDRIRDQAREVFEEEKRKAESLHASKMDSMRKLHEQEMLEIATQEAKHKGNTSSTYDEERRAAIEAAQHRCEEKYGSQLGKLEKESADLQAQIAKTTAELVREVQCGGDGERVAAEKAAATERDTLLRNVDIEMGEYRANKQKELEDSFRTRRAAQDSTHEAKLRRLKEEMESTTRSVEVATAMSVEKRRVELEAERKHLDEQLTSIAVPPAPTAAAAPSAGSVTAKVREIETRQAATCAAIRRESQRKQATLKEAKERELADLRRQLHADPLSSTVASETSNSELYQQFLSMLKQEQESKRTASLSNLSREREAKLKKVGSLPTLSRSASAASKTPLTSADASACFLISEAVQALKAENAAAYKAKREYYQQLEEEWKAKIVQEMAEASSSTQEVLLQSAIDTDMDLFVKEVTAKRERIRAEFQQRRDKALETHRVAKETYERHRIEHDTQKRREVEDMKNQAIEEAVRDGVEAERRRLHQDMVAVLARNSTKSDQEANAIRKEVDEELWAYEQQERRQLSAAAVEQRAKASKASPQPMDPQLTARHTVLLQQQEDLRVNHQAARDALRQTVAEREAELNRLQAEVAALNTNPSPPQLIAVDPTVPMVAVSQQRPVVKRVNVITKLVQPLHSTLRLTHEARLTALEDGYRRQETALREEIAQSITRRTAAAAAVGGDASGPDHWSTTPVGGAASPQACTPLSRHDWKSPMTQVLPSPAPSAGVSPEVASIVRSPVNNIPFHAVDAMRLLHTQQANLVQRQQSLQQAREEWTMERLDTQATFLSAPAVGMPGPAALPMSALTPYTPQVGSELVAVVDTLHDRLDLLGQRIDRMEKHRDHQRCNSHSCSPRTQGKRAARRMVTDKVPVVRAHSGFTRQRVEEDSCKQVQSRWGAMLRAYRSTFRA